MKNFLTNCRLPVVLLGCLLTFGSAPLSRASALQEMLSSFQNGRQLELSGQFDLDQSSLSQRPMGTLSGQFDMNVKRRKASWWFLTSSVEIIDLGTDQVNVGQDHVPVGGVLESYEAGLGYKYQFKDEKAYGVSVEYGSASDKVFSDPENTTVSGNFAYVLPPQKAGQWAFFLNYSNNRTFLNNIPLPGFMYMYDPKGSFSASLGIPFVFLRWMSFPEFTLNVFITPASAGVDAGVGVWGPLQVFTEASFEARAFKHKQRTKKDFRFILEEKTVSVGIRAPFSRSLRVDLSTGLAFDRYYYQGHGAYQPVGPTKELSEQVFIHTTLKSQF